MKRLKPHLFALVFVSVWGQMAWVWMGSEDGSSGFSPLGWLLFPYVLPGAFCIAKLKGIHSNADIPLMFGLSWSAYLLFSLAIVEMVLMVRKTFRKDDKAA